MVEVGRGVEGRTFRSLQSKYNSNFMRLSAINSRNLFKIRSSSVEINQPGTMDIYKIFTNFFEVDRDDYETQLNGFKTLFP